MDDGVNLTADVWTGNPARAVVLLHGGGQTRHSWHRTGANLATRGLSVVALDTRGHGDSDWSPDGDYRPERLAQDLGTVVQQLGVPVTLVGASLGGLTALLAAPALQDGWLEALVLVDVVPRYEAAGAERIKNFMVAAPNGFADLDEAAAAISAYLPHRNRVGASQGLRKNLRQRVDGRWHWHWDPAFLQNPALGGEERIRRLEHAARRLHVPTLLIRGLLSDVLSDEGVAAFLAIAPQSEYVVLDKAAHTAAADDNDAFSEAVLAFIGSASSGS
jgi:pimeloyl-ACP methyl ester carboxylesterase